MLGNVRGWYPKVGVFAFPLKYQLLPNRPDLAEYKA
jgi:hypothetical protein